jgi:DNA-binding XRE family transcriptional regulator
MASQHSPPPRSGAPAADAGAAGAPATGASGADRPSARQALLVGRKLRKLRKDRRLDQAELAALVGLQPADVAGIEKGEYRISLDVLFRMLAVFEANVADFIEEGAGAAFARRLPFPVRDR